MLLFAAGCAGPRSAAIATVAPTRIGGLDYLPLQSLCQRTQAACQWDRRAQTVTVQLGALQMAGKENSPSVTINGIPQRLAGPIVVYRGVLMVPRVLEDWLSKIGLQPAIPPAAAAGANVIRRVILDPGHGGHDPGATGPTGVREKEVVLDLARRLRDHLAARGVEVLMTRADDTFVSLGGRTRLAAEQQADLFLSIHANASRNKRVHGVEAYYLREAQDGSGWAWSAAAQAAPPMEGRALDQNRTLKAILWDLAHAEHRREAVELGMRFCRTLREQLQLRSRGVRGARFHVLRTATMPAVLLEIGYLSNPEEERRLADPAFREAMAGALADGALHYLHQYAQSNGFAR